MHYNYKNESIFYTEIVLPLNQLFVFQKEYKEHEGVEISLKPVPKRPDAKGVLLLAKFILLKYDIFSFSMFKTQHSEKFDYIRYEFSYKLKYKANLTETFTITREKFYRLNDMQETFKQKANKLYPYYKQPTIS